MSHTDSKPAVVRIRTTLHFSSQVLKSVAIGYAASQLAKHKQVYKWAAERVLNRTDLSWSRSKMLTLALLLDVQHFTPHQVRDAVLSNFTAGTVLESAKGGPLILTATICPRWMRSLNSSPLKACQQLLQHPPAETTTAIGGGGSHFVLSCANLRP